MLVKIRALSSHRSTMAPVSVAPSELLDSRAFLGGSRRRLRSFPPPELSSLAQLLGINFHGGDAIGDGFFG